MQSGILTEWARLVHGAVRVWALHPAERWTSRENGGGRTSLTHGTGNMLPRSCEEALCSSASVAHAHSVRPTHRECFLPLCYLSDSLQQILEGQGNKSSCHICSATTGSMYLCFSDPVSTCSVCVSTCMSKSLCNILFVCLLHVLGNEMYWAVLPLWSLCYNFLICSEKKGNNTALTNWFITNCKCSDTHGERPSRSVFILGKEEILLCGLAQDYKILGQKLSVLGPSKRGVTTSQPVRKKEKTVLNVRTKHWSSFQPVFW